jgi:phenylacetate-CoA ligase
MVELAPGASVSSGDAKSAASLQHAIKAYVGVSADVRLMPVGTIERSIGKAKRVIDKRPK